MAEELEDDDLMARGNYFRALNEAAEKSRQVHNDCGSLLPVFFIDRIDENKGLLYGVCCEQISETGWYLCNFFVSKELRKRGFGTALLAEAEKEIFKRGGKSVWLYTGSESAANFYLKREYTEVVDPKDPIHKEGVRAFVKEVRNAGAHI